MSPVKFVHVLKRIEILDRDIEELKKLDDVMAKNRSYSHALKISLELQINGLLGERVKLMELRIENPPEQLIPSHKEIEDPSIKIPENRGKFKFEDFENNYLEAVEEGLNSKNTSPMLNQNQIDEYLSVREKPTEAKPKETLTANNSIISEFSRDETIEVTKPTTTRKQVPYDKPKDTIKTLSREELLRNLPKANF